jgi:hypothetical protein
VNINLRNRWLIAAGIWLVALGLTFWNLSKVGDIASTREQNERLRREVSFQRRHIEKLIGIEKVHANLFLSVESVNLGLIALRSDLLSLAAALGLQEANLTSDVTQAGDSQIPVNLRIQGTFRKTAGYLAVIEKKPYLQITHTYFKVVNEKGDTETDIAFTFRYSIKPPAADVQDPTRLMTQQPDHGAKPI